jgi:hypothetical protein
MSDQNGIQPGREVETPPQSFQPWKAFATSRAHFGCGAGRPPEVPGGGTTFGSCASGAGFSMAGSTSFGWMTPFDCFSFSLRFWPAVGLAPVSPCAEPSGPVGALGAWANAEPATSVMLAINRRSLEQITLMRS